jgi:ATP-dependent Lhr-like helicase
LLVPDADEVERLVVRQLGSTADVFRAVPRSGRPRAAAAPPPARRAGAACGSCASAPPICSRWRPGSGSFPIILETYRECLRDIFDLPALTGILARIQSRSLRVVNVESNTPSPFSSSLLFGYVANYIYDGDAPLAERRAQRSRSISRSCAI